MISPEILKKIKEIEIRTRRVMNGTLVGGHVTKQKGSGFEFDQIRRIAMAMIFDLWIGIAALDLVSCLFANI